MKSDFISWAISWRRVSITILVGAIVFLIGAFLFWYFLFYIPATQDASRDQSEQQQMQQLQ